MYEFEWSNRGAYFKRLLTLTIILVAGYSTAYFIIGDSFSIPEGHCWAVFLVLICGHVGGFIAVQLRVPALMGMLIMGLALQNLPGDILRGYKHSWESKIKAFGLATILMRAGLKINYMKAPWTAFLEAPWTVVMLGLIPVLTEGFIDLLIFNQVYGMPFLLSGTGGFLLAAISPTVVVTGMLDLQKKGYGAEKSIPSVEMAAAGVDVIVGIAMFSIFQSLSMQDASGSDDKWSLARGASSVGLGFAAALVGGFICGCTKVFNKPWARSASVFTLGQMFMFIFYHYHMPGGGALASIGTAGCAAMCWLFGFPGFMSSGRTDAYRTAVDEHIAIFWIYIMQPLLFCTIGVSINFDYIPATVLPKAILLIFVGSSVRMLAAAMSCIPAKLTRKEMAFVALSWIPKATVQGEMTQTPGIESALSPDNPNYDQYILWGYDILATAVISIFITAPIGLLIISMAGPRLLTKEELPKQHSGTHQNAAYTIMRVSVDPTHNREIEVIMDNKNQDVERVDTATEHMGHMLALEMDHIYHRKRDEGTQVDSEMLSTAMEISASPELCRARSGMPGVTARRYKSLLHQELGVIDRQGTSSHQIPDQAAEVHPLKSEDSRVTLISNGRAGSLATSEGAPAHPPSTHFSPFAMAAHALGFDTISNSRRSDTVGSVLSRAASHAVPDGDLKKTAILRRSDAVGSVLSRAASHAVPGSEPKKE
eukprot:gene19862-26557_t